MHYSLRAHVILCPALLQIGRSAGFYQKPLRLELPTTYHIKANQSNVVTGQVVYRPLPIRIFRQ